MVKVKICGIKNTEDAAVSCEYGADYLGFIFIKDTPRFLRKQEAADIIKAIPAQLKDKISLVGLFRNEDPEEISSAILECGLNMVQLQGEEKPGECDVIKKKTGCCVAKAFKVTGTALAVGSYSPVDYAACDYFVFDTFHPRMYGGTGEVFDWKMLDVNRPLINKPFFVAGGLNPGNVAGAVLSLKPYGVDVSSGVESSPGKKDIKLLKEFIKNAKAT